MRGGERSGRPELGAGPVGKLQVQDMLHAEGWAGLDTWAATANQASQFRHDWATSGGDKFVFEVLQVIAKHVSVLPL